MNKYLLLDNPQKAFEEIFKEIKNAKKNIYIESYKILNDSIGKKLIDLLLKKEKDGVKIKIICDYLGWGNFSKERIKKISESKIELYIFNPIFKKISLKSLRKYWNIHFRNHRKLTIIDDKYAFVGGINYTKEELEWNDIMVKITGKIVDDLISSSHEMTGFAKKEHFGKRHIYKKLSKNFYHDDIIVRQIPYSRHRLLKKELIKIFNEAQKEILIVTPYLIPDLPFRRALKRAIDRGIKIKIIIPGKSDNWFLNHMNHFSSYIANNAGIEVFLYPGMIHSKYVIIDSNIASFGSANLDYQTFNHNYELNIVSKNKSLVKQLKKSFHKDSKNSNSYHEKTWSKKIWINKLIVRLLLKHRRHF